MKTLADPNVRQSVTERLRRLRPRTTPAWGRMSSHQMLCHLCDSYKVATGARKVSAAPGLIPRTLFKWIALYLPAPWPKGVQTMPEVEQGTGGTPPVEFERDRQNLLHIIEEFCGGNGQSLAKAHPIFGSMRQADWMRWGYLHADHHLRQFGL